MTSRLNSVFELDKDLLSIFVTAGFPAADATIEICEELEAAGVDFIELGMPFSDSVADGPTIQKANDVALANGITVERALEMLRAIRMRVSVPIVLMGGFNPVLQYGVERFLADAADAGADATILPDLSFDYYKSQMKKYFQASPLSNIFLISPNTSEERIREIDAESESFIYAVSSPGVTGGSIDASYSVADYLERLQSMNLNAPVMVGFGIESRKQMSSVCQRSRGVIVGSAFIRAIADTSDVRKATKTFFDNFNK